MSLASAIVSTADAQRLTQRIKLTATTVRDNMRRLWDLVEEAKTANVHQVLGYASWTAYLADTLGEEPLRLSRDERQEVVAMLAGEGLSTRAIAPIVGVHHSAVARDLERSAGVAIATPAPDAAEPSWEVPAWVDPHTGEVDEAPAEPVARIVTGLDGKSYSSPSTPGRQAPRRPLIDDVRSAGYKFREALERLERIKSDDRFTRNKAEILAALQPHLDFAQEVLADLTTPADH